MTNNLTQTIAQKLEIEKEQKKTLRHLDSPISKPPRELPNTSVVKKQVNQRDKIRQKNTRQMAGFPD